MPQCIPKRSCNGIRGRFHGIGGEMGIARRCLHLCVAEEFADHRKPAACRHGGRGEGVAHILDAGPFPDSPPWRLEIGEVGAWVLAGDDPKVVLDPLDPAEHLQSGRADMDRLRTGLGIGQVEGRALEIDIVPLEGHDLRQSAPGAASVQVAEVAPAIGVRIEVPSASTRYHRNV